MSECSVKHLKWGATWPSRGPLHRQAAGGERVYRLVGRQLAEELPAGGV